MKRYVCAAVAIDHDTLHRLKRLVRGTNRPLSRFVAEILRDYVHDVPCTRQHKYQRRAA